MKMKTLTAENKRASRKRKTPALLVEGERGDGKGILQVGVKRRSGRGEKSRGGKEIGGKEGPLTRGVRKNVGPQQTCGTPAIRKRQGSKKKPGEHFLRTPKVPGSSKKKGVWLKGKGRGGIVVPIAQKRETPPTGGSRRNLLSIRKGEKNEGEGALEHFKKLSGRRGRLDSG